MGLYLVLLACCASFYVFRDPMIHAIPNCHRSCFSDRFISAWVSCCRVIVYEKHDGPFHFCYAPWGIQLIGKSSCTEDEMLTSQQLTCDLCVMVTQTKSFWKGFNNGAVQLQIEFKRLRAFPL